MCTKLVTMARRFRADRSGNIAILFALSILPVLAFIGAAVDYTMANKIRTKLTSMLDSALLVAVSAGELGKSAAQAQSDATSYLNGLLASQGISATVSVSVKDTGQSRSATGSFTSSMGTTFMKLAGFPTMTLSNSATSTVSLPVYMDFYLLLDNSPSMGVAATTAGIDTMVNNPSTQCAFACHDLSNPNDFYSIAKSLGVTMRIDVVRQAVQQLTTTATQTAVVTNQFRMALYTFGTSCTSTGLTGVAALSSSMSGIQSAASKIDLMTIPYQGYNNDQCTDFDGVLDDMNSAIPTPGSGTSGAPQKWLFFVSDGVADASYRSSCNKPLSGSTRCQEPLNVATCTKMKNRGINIAVLYTTYLALPTNWWYNNWIAPFNAGPYGPSPNSEIAQNMQACASPGYYFEVSPSQGISDAMNTLFLRAVSKARLST